MARKAAPEPADDLDDDTPAPKRKGMPVWGWLLIAVGAVVLVCGGCGVAGFAIKRAGVKPPAVQMKTIEAQKLLNAYRNNPVSAEQHFGTKRFVVTGTVKFIDIGGVHLVGEEDDGTAIMCFGLSKNEIASINRGSTISVEGRVTLGNAGGIYFSDCRLP